MNAPNAPVSHFADCSFTQLTEVYRLLKQKGEVLDTDALVALAPHLEPQIREQFPLVAMLDNAMGDERQNQNTETKPIPASVAGCVLNEEIGRGGMGVVFRAHQPELNRDVAVKIIQLNCDLSSQSERLELERHALARLEHPNIIPAYSFTQDSQYAYLVMKLISGYGLNQLIDGEGDFKAQFLINELRSNWATLAAMAADVASGLQHSHENGLVHRDIKPANLLLDKDGKIWISDFGLAKMNNLAYAISQTGDMVGTPKYMAPEQIQGVCDPRSDIYSLGVTLYELAAGQSARGKDWKPNQILEGSLPQIQDIRELNPEIPVHLAHVIMKACRFLPEDRYQSAEELEIVLRRFVDGRVADRRKKKRKPDAVYRKEFRRNAALAIAGSVLLFGAITYYMVRPTKVETANTNQGGNILDVLADTKRTSLDDKFAEKLRKEIIEAAQNLELPEDEKRELQSEINVVYAQLKEGEASHTRIGNILDRYSDSNFATATKIWRANSAIKNSRMSAEEISKAIAVVHRFAYLAAKERMSVGAITRLNNSLTGGRDVPADEFRKIRFSTDHLRRWIASVDKNTRDLMLPGEQVDISTEIRKLFVPDDNSTTTTPRYSNQSPSMGNSNRPAPDQWPPTNSSRINIPDGISEADIEQFTSGLTPEQKMQLENRINGIR